MKTFAEQPNRTNAESVAAACILLVMLAMGASTFFTHDPSAVQITAGVATARVTQAYHPGLVKKI
jgi:hypothetical protein